MVLGASMTWPLPSVRLARQCTLLTKGGSLASKPLATLRMCKCWKPRIKCSRSSSILAPCRSRSAIRLKLVRNRGKPIKR